MRLRLGGQLGVAGRTDLGLEPSRDGGAQRPGLIARVECPIVNQRHAAAGTAGGRFNSRVGAALAGASALAGAIGPRRHAPVAAAGGCYPRVATHPGVDTGTGTRSWGAIRSIPWSSSVWRTTG